MRADDVSALILAGGRATRLGGIAKHELVIDGETIFARQCRVLAPRVAEILVSSPQPIAGFRTVGDAVTGAGPLAGIAAGLAAVRTPWLLVIAGDMPYVTGELIDALLARARDGADAVCVRERGLPEPLVSLLHARSRARVEARLAAGRYKASGVFTDEGLEVEWLDDPDPRALRSINQPSDLRAQVGDDDTVPAVTASTAPTRGSSVMLAEGAMVGRYRIERCLGKGGMGVVYRAHDTELDRAVALKLVHPSVRGVEDLAERLRRESRLQARAAHRAVITVYDVGRTGDDVYVAMELIRGGTLREWLAAAPRGWRDVLDVFREVAAGLGAAHAAGLVHRDIKPDNILVETVDDRVTRVLVTDFGVARAVEASGEPIAGGGAVPESIQTEAGAIVGTPAYMSPEQIDGRPVEARADVFSFCVALWEALYGARPFVGASLAAIAAAMDGPPVVPEPRDDRERVPSWIADVVRTGLAREVTARATIDALVEQLDWRRRRRRRRVAISAVSAGIAAAAILIPAVLLRAGDPDPCAGPAEVAARLRDVRARWSAAGDGVTPALAEYWRASVDDYVRGWEALREQACRDPRADNVAARVRCLDNSGAEVAALLADTVGLSPAPRKATMRGLPLAVPRECLTAAADRVAAFRPQDPMVWRARRLFAQADGVADSEKQVALADLVAAAQAAKLPAVQHELAVLTAQTESAKADQLRDAATAADRADLPLVAARAWLEVLTRVLDKRESPEHARDLLAQADGAISRAGNPVIERARWLAANAALIADGHDVAKAVAAIDEAKRFIAEQKVPTDLRTLAPLATAYLRADHPDLGLEVTERGLAFVNLIEAKNYERIQFTHNHALNLAHLGKGAEARALLVHMLEHHDRSRKLEEEALVDSIELVSETLQTEGDSAGALDWMKSWQPAIDATIDGDSEPYGHAELERAIALASLGKFTEAELATRHAVEIFAAHDGASDVLTADARILDGQILSQLGQFDAARAALERGIADRAKVDPDHERVAQGTRVLAELLMDHGHLDEARPHLERFLAWLQAHDGQPGEIGEAEVRIARTLVASDPARARTLVDHALAQFATAPDDNASRIAAARALRGKLGLRR